jgi:hypothetical protein
MEPLVRSNPATSAESRRNIVLNVRARQTVDFKKIASGGGRKPSRLGQSACDIKELLFDTRRKEPTNLSACAALNVVVIGTTEDTDKVVGKSS